MNDSYIFRGKDLSNVWRIGALLTESSGSISYILVNSRKEDDNSTSYRIGHTVFQCYEVDPSTIGIYTGICEDMGNKDMIFEGDIVQTNDGIYVIKQKCEEINYLIANSLDDLDFDGIDEFATCRYTDYGNKRVVGNIHDDDVEELLHDFVIAGGKCDDDDYHKHTTEDKNG